MRNRRAAWIAVVAAALSAGGHAASPPARQETDGPLRVVTFTLPEGEVRVHLPSDLAAGDALSGTVVAEPRGETEAARDGNRAALAALRLELAGATGRVVEGERRTQEWRLPGVLDPTVSLRLLSPGGRPLAEAEMPVATGAAAPAGFTLPAAAARGRALAVGGAFDGRAVGTGARVGGVPVVVLAESPRLSLLETRPDRVGPLEVVIEEGGVTARGTTRVVGIDLRADRLDLRRGQSTPLRVTVSGLDSLEEPLELRVTNRSPAVVELAGGETVTLELAPGEAGPGGTLQRELRLTGRARGAFSIGSELSPTGPPRTMAVTTSPPSAGSAARPSRAEATSGAAGPQAPGATVLVAAGDPCDPGVAILLSRLAEMERLLGGSREELLANPLVQEILAYQAWLELAAAGDGVRRALDRLLAEGVDAFLAELESEESRTRALRLLQRLARHLERDPSLGGGLRRASGRLAAGLERVIEAAGDAAAARERLGELVAELQEALDDPLEYLREQTVGAIAGRLQEQLALRFGAKAAGALASMVADLAAFADALQSQGEIDERRRALVELRRRLVAAAGRDPCFTLDESWLAESRAGDKGIVFPNGWAGREVTLTARLVCLDGGEPPRFVACRPSPVTLGVGERSGSSLAVTVPAPRPAASSSVVLYSLAVGSGRCGSHCYVEIEVAGAEDGTVFGLFLGAMPLH